MFLRCQPHGISWHFHEFYPFLIYFLHYPNNTDPSKVFGIINVQCEYITNKRPRIPPRLIRKHVSLIFWKHIKDLILNLNSIALQNTKLTIIQLINSVMFSGMAVNNKNNETLWATVSLPLVQLDTRYRKPLFPCSPHRALCANRHPSFLVGP